MAPWKGASGRGLLCMYGDGVARSSAHKPGPTLCRRQAAGWLGQMGSQAGATCPPLVFSFVLVFSLVVRVSTSLIAGSCPPDDT